MASSKEFVDYVCEQMRDAGEILTKRMFGEYGLYLNGKFFAAICDNQLFLKPTGSGAALFESPSYAPPYEGAKDYLLVENLDDTAFLAKLVLCTCDELPLPKPKKPKKT